METNVAIAILSASVGLAGLMLVFLGFVVSVYQSYPRDTSSSIRDYFRAVLGISSYAFIICIIGATLAMTYLISSESRVVYTTAIVFFFIEIYLILGVALITVRMLRRF